MLYLGGGEYLESYRGDPHPVVLVTETAIYPQYLQSAPNEMSLQGTVKKIKMAGGLLIHGPHSRFILKYVRIC